MREGGCKIECTSERKAEFAVILDIIFQFEIFDPFLQSCS